ncbi:hypothetical protein HDF19_00595 [Mucilaginibacter sp. E4BP6]|uniref:hypothetical protein n=1 Tax=Mucilaginibacter sp. E4BP6 TaxID=2723089 RepID=UPI0015C84818|nr:hypothetical protein [Mucilaginibacter sp. E4BP6]NYE66922.1 hypothetical protein [Mucilaginibacter sp. E4BP6]
MASTNPLCGMPRGQTTVFFRGAIFQIPRPSGRTTQDEWSDRHITLEPVKPHLEHQCV